MAVPLPTEEELDSIASKALQLVLEEGIQKVIVSFAAFGDDIRNGEGLLPQVNRGAMVQTIWPSPNVRKTTNLYNELRAALAPHGAHLFQDFFLGIDEFASGRFIYDFENIPFSCKLERWEKKPTGHAGKYHLVDHRPF